MIQKLCSSHKPRMFSWVKLGRYKVHESVVYTETRWHHLSYRPLSRGVGIRDDGFGPNGWDWSSTGEQRTLSTEKLQKTGWGLYDRTVLSIGPFFLEIRLTFIPKS